MDNKTGPQDWINMSARHNVLTVMGVVGSIVDILEQQIYPNGAPKDGPGKDRQVKCRDQLCFQAMELYRIKI